MYVRIAQHNTPTPFESLNDGDLVSEPVFAFHLPWVPRKWAGWRSKTTWPRQLAWKGKCEPAWRAGVVSHLAVRLSPVSALGTCFSSASTVVC